MSKERSVFSTCDVPLTPNQVKVGRMVAQGMSWGAATRLAGGGNRSTNRVNPRLLAFVHQEQKKFEAEAQMTRAKVLKGLEDSIEMARIMSEPMTMVAGWREIGKMCGYYEPVKHTLDISVNGQLSIQALQSLPDAELLRLAEKATQIDADYAEVP